MGALNLSDRLRAVPLLGALIPMVAGIVCGTFLDVPFYFWATATAICGTTAWFCCKRPVLSLVYVVLAMLFFGAALARAHAPQISIPRGRRVWLEMVITDNPSGRPGSKSARTSGVATKWRSATAPESASTRDPADLSSDEWQKAGEKLLVAFDTVWRFEVGDRVVFRGYVNPISDTANSYSRLMYARGYTGLTYISQYSRPAVEPAKTKSLATFARKMQAGATARLWRLAYNRAGDAGDTGSMKSTGAGAWSLDAGIAVAAAMTTGDRGAITPELRKAYSRTGASHLLAVSGLHVGIVFLVINIILYLVPLVRRGHIVKNIVAIAAIWLYAALTGLSPSAVRAAFMFSGAQIALATSRARSGANIMFGAALVMLAVKPGLLLDISFQLSFIAVAAIMAWFGPLYRLLESRWRGLNALWATLVVGLVASTATMPLVSHTFGVFSPAGIVLNPIVILTAHLVVIFSLVWIIAPVPFLEPVFRWLVGGAAWLQNKVVESVAGVPGAAIEWTMPLWMVFTIYAIMIIFTVWLVAHPRKDEGFTLSKE